MRRMPFRCLGSSNRNCILFSTYKRSRRWRSQNRRIDDWSWRSQNCSCWGYITESYFLYHHSKSLNYILCLMNWFLISEWVFITFWLHYLGHWNTLEVCYRRRSRGWWISSGAFSAKYEACTGLVVRIRSATFNNESGWVETLFGTAWWKCQKRRIWWWNDSNVRLQEAKTCMNSHHIRKREDLYDYFVLTAKSSESNPDIPASEPKVLNRLLVQMLNPMHSGSG